MNKSLVLSLSLSLSMLALGCGKAAETKECEAYFEAAETCATAIEKSDMQPAPMREAKAEMIRTGAAETKKSLSEVRPSHASKLTCETLMADLKQNEACK